MGLSPFSSLFCWLNQHEISMLLAEENLPRQGGAFQNSNSQVVDVDVALKVVKSTVPHAACRWAQITGQSGPGFGGLEPWNLTIWLYPLVDIPPGKLT